MRTLASELVLPHHTLRNRVIMGSMHTGFEEHPEGAEHLAAFYAERAKNGVALIITGGIGPNEAGAVTDGGAKLTNAKKWRGTVSLPKPCTHTARKSVCRFCTPAAMP